MKTKPTPKKKKRPTPRYDDQCDSPLPVRRSIPVSEVNEMLNRQAAELTKDPTIYDKRLRLIENLDNFNARLFEAQNEIRYLNLRIAETAKELDETNQQIRSELDLDSVR